MSVFFAHVAAQVVLAIGGTLKSTLDLLFSCKPIDGSLTQEMSTLKRDLRRLEEIRSLTNAIKLESVLWCALRA